MSRLIATCSTILTVASLAMTNAGQARAAASHRVALTFDDLPVHGALPPGVSRLDIARGIVETLRARRIPPTFGFVNAHALAEDPALGEVLRVWRTAGHPLGNHTYTHIDLHATTVEAFERDVQANEPVLRTYMDDGDWKWLRFPYLHEGESLQKQRAVASFLADRGYRVAEVTLSFDDWAFSDPYARCAAARDPTAIAWIEERFLRRAAESVTLDLDRTIHAFGHDVPHVMLLHAGAITARMLPMLLRQLDDHGFRFITLQEAQRDPAYAISMDRAFPSGATWVDRVAAAKGIRAPASVDDTIARLDALCR